jgi:predicted Co/Zn/Cd cation transporter (cation efflux family)
LNVIYTLFTYCAVYVIPVVVMLVAYATIAVELQRTCRGTVVVVADRRRRRLLLTMAPPSTTPQSRSHVTTLEHENVSSLTNESYLTTSGVQVQHSNDVIETMTSPVTSSEVERQRRLRDRRVIVRMLVAIVLLFAVSWFPFFTLQVIGD